MVIGIYAGSAGRRPVRLAHMDGKITCIFEILDQGIGVLRMRNARNGADAVYVPVGTGEQIARRSVAAAFVLRHPESAPGCVGRRVAHGGSPVGDVGMGGVHARHYAGARRGRHGAGISIPEHGAALAQPLHVGCVEPKIVGVKLVAVLHAAVDPAEVIDQEEHNVRAFRGPVGAGSERKKGGKARDMPYFHIFSSNWAGM